MKKIVLISILVLSYLSSISQEEILNSLESKAFTAYINSNVSMWKQIAREADKLLSDKNTDTKTRIEAIKLKYGLLYCCLSNQDKVTYEENQETVEKQLNKLLEEVPGSSDLHTISAALMSVQMGFSPMKGMTLGSLSGKQIDKALDLDSLNANAWRQYASSKYFTPKMWGGDISEAISGYNLAILLYEKNNETDNWFYIDSMVWLGIAYEKNGEKENARSTYEKVLKIAPEFGWVKYHLLPNLNKS